MLEEMGIPVEYSHHEVAPSQHEIDLRYTDASDHGRYRDDVPLAVKEVAIRYGFYATFMPKPVASVNGNGMHVNMSLFQGDRNVFFEEDDPYRLSQLARCFVAGLMKHAQEITAVTNQWVNSYKRLVPGYEAPVYISWAKTNRSDLIRVPAFRQGKEESVRVEYRAPDPACNPYLAFSVLLAAGLEGIEKEYPVPDPVEANVYQMSEEERRPWAWRHCRGASLKQSAMLSRASWLNAPLANTFSIASSRTKRSSGTAIAPTSRTTRSNGICRCFEGHFDERRQTARTVPPRV